MPIVQIAPVTRQGMKLLISLYGLSETGKTYSALKLAAGIEPDPSKRALCDSEGGQRGRAYYNAIPGGYLYGSLTPPFTPERYIEALDDFVAAGVTTLVIDSVSHCWNAEGGILDMVETATEKNDMAKWARPKRRLGKLTRKWLSCDMHLILCSRGKQTHVEEIGQNGKKIYVPGPVVPIQEKSLRFDLTIMAQMLGDGHFTIDKAHGGKCPGELRPIFTGGQLMDETMGRRLIDWLGGQDATSPEQRQLAYAADEAAQGGVEAFRIHWAGLSQGAREFLRGKMANFQSIAQAADNEAKRTREGEIENASAEDLDALSKPFDGAALPDGVQRVGEAA